MKELSKQDIEVVLAGKGLPGELLAGESLAKYFARLYLHTKDSRDEQLSQRDAQIAALKADFILLDRQMSFLERTGITDRDRADKAELENDEVRQRLANAEHQLFMKDLAIHNIKASRKAQFRKRKEAEAQLAALTAENVALKESRSVLSENALESCNDISAVYQHEAIMRGLYQSTGNRNKYPKPITTLVDEALRNIETPATDAAANALRSEGAASVGTLIRACAHEFPGHVQDIVEECAMIADNAANQLREGK